MALQVISDMVVSPDIPEMSRDQAEKAVDQYIACGNVQRWILLAMYEGRAHKALGYGSWPEFAAERLGLFYTENHHYKLLRTARVERNVIGSPSYDPIGASSPIISVPIAIELAKLETPEQQREAWDIIEGMRASGYRTSVEILGATKRTVKGLLSPAGTNQNEGQDPRETNQPTPSASTSVDGLSPVGGEISEDADRDDEDVLEVSTRAIESEPDILDVATSSRIFVPEDRSPGDSQYNLPDHYAVDPDKERALSLVYSLVAACRSGDQGAVVALCLEADNFLSEHRMRSLPLVSGMPRV